MRRKKGVKCLSKIKKTEATVLRANYNMTDREQTITEINESMQSKQKKMTGHFGSTLFISLFSSLVL